MIGLDLPRPPFPPLPPVARPAATPQAERSARLAALAGPVRRVCDWLLGPECPEFVAASPAEPLTIRTDRLALLLGLAYGQVRRAVDRLARLGLVVHHVGAGSAAGTKLSPGPLLAVAVPQPERLPLFEPRPVPAPVPVLPAGNPRPAALAEPRPPAPPPPIAIPVSAPITVPVSPSPDPLPPPVSPPAAGVPGGRTAPGANADLEAELFAEIARKTRARPPACVPPRAGVRDILPVPSVESKDNPSPIPAPERDAADASAALGRMMTEPAAVAPATPPPTKRIEERAVAWQTRLADPGTAPWIFRWLSLEADPVDAPGMLRRNRLDRGTVDRLVDTARDLARSPQARASVGAIFVGLVKRELAKLKRCWPRWADLRTALDRLAGIALDPLLPQRRKAVAA